MSDLSFAKQFGPDYPPPFPDWFFTISEAVHRLLDDPRFQQLFYVNLLQWRDELPEGPIEIPAGKEPLPLPWMYLILAIIHDAVEDSREEGILGKAMTVNPWPHPDGIDVNETATYEQFLEGHKFIVAKVCLVPGLKGTDQRWVENALRDIERNLLMQWLLDGADDIKLSAEEYKRLKLALESDVLIKDVSADECDRLKMILDRNRPRVERGKNPAGSEKAANRKTIQSSGSTVNQRMLEAITNDTHAVSGWTANRWAQRLNCARSTVTETPAWRMLAESRDKLKAERAADRRHNQKPNKARKHRTS